MKLSMNVTLNLKTKDTKDTLDKAVKLSMRDTVVEIANESAKNSPKLTGNNMRSIAYESSGFGMGSLVAKDKVEGAVYSTSGYGGWLEVGTGSMGKRPYMNPAREKHFTPEKFAGKVRKHTK